MFNLIEPVMFNLTTQLNVKMSKKSEFQFIAEKFCKIKNLGLNYNLIPNLYIISC